MAPVGHLVLQTPVALAEDRVDHEPFRRLGRLTTKSMASYVQAVKCRRRMTHTPHPRRLRRPAPDATVTVSLESSVSALFPPRRTPG